MDDEFQLRGQMDYSDEDCWREINEMYPEEPEYVDSSGTVDERLQQKKRLTQL